MIRNRIPPAVSAESSSNNVLVWGSSCFNKIDVESLFAFAFWLLLASLSKEWEAFEKQFIFLCCAFLIKMVKLAMKLGIRMQP